MVYVKKFADVCRENAERHHREEANKKAITIAENIKKYEYLYTRWYNDMLQHIIKRSVDGYTETTVRFTRPDDCMYDTYNLYVDKVVKKLTEDGFRVVIYTSSNDDWYGVTRLYGVKW